MKRGLVIGVRALGVFLVLRSAALAGVPTGPIPTFAQFRNNCRPTVSERDCILGLPRTPDRVGGDFLGGYTDQVDGVESVIDREGAYHLRTNASAPTAWRHIWVDLSEGSGRLPFAINYTKEASITTRGTVPLYDMKVSTDRDPVPYVGTLELHFSAESWNGILLFDKVIITRIDPDSWTIAVSEVETAKLTDRDRQVLGTYALPFSLMVKKLPGSP
jgi:hypothetical protein